MQTYIICNAISVILIAIVQIMHSFELKKLWGQQQKLHEELEKLKKIAAFVVALQKRQDETVSLFCNGKEIYRSNESVKNDTEIQQSINNGVISAIEAIDDNDEAKPLSAD